MPYRRSSPLTARVQFRLTAAEKNAIIEQAQASGMTLSNYCRHRVLGHPVFAETDMAMIRELRRLGGLLKHVHTQSRGVYRSQTKSILDAIRRYIELLSMGEDP